MLPEIGLFFLILSSVFAFLQITIPFVNKNVNNILVNKLINLQIIGIVFSFCILSYLFISSDFSVLYVAKNSNLNLDFIYKVCALWGAHEGSILLWLLLLQIWFFIAKKDKDNSYSFSVINFILLQYIIWFSNPFARIFMNIPDNGLDLNPLLQDPGFIIHPPLLYLGYVGYAAIFCIDLNHKNFVKNLKLIQRINIISWGFLTLGITIGSFWAYYELGWGGFWYWDPVENASFMPWLLGTALTHNLIINIRKNILIKSSYLLIIYSFALSVFGTFLVRSGVLNSVHAFASDPKRGLYLLAVTLLIVAIGYIKFFKLNFETNKDKERKSELGIKEILLVLNSLLLTISASIVLLGTLYPLVLEVFEISSITVGPGYFNTVLIPVFIPLLILLGLSPNFNKAIKDKKQVYKKIFFLLSVALILSVFINYLIYKIYNEAYLSIFISTFTFIWILVNLFYDAIINLINKRYSFVLKYLSFYIAHLGVAITLIGIAMSTMYLESSDVMLKIGDKANLGNYEFTLDKIKRVSKSNYLAKVAYIKVNDKKYNLDFVMHPEKRFYTNSQMLLTEVALKGSFLKDIYLALGDVITDPKNLNIGHITLRIKIMPFIRFIWLGGVFIFIAALISFARLRKE